MVYLWELLYNAERGGECMLQGDNIDPTLYPQLHLMAVALSPCAMAAAFYSYYKSEWAPYSNEELPNGK
ncbi:unnamed protein product [Gadus morhua 'NCC']